MRILGAIALGGAFIAGALVAVCALKAKEKLDELEFEKLYSGLDENEDWDAVEESDKLEKAESKASKREPVSFDEDEE